jgi:hypothetical protein
MHLLCGLLGLRGLRGLQPGSCDGYHHTFLLLLSAFIVTTDINE